MKRLRAMLQGESKVMISYALNFKRHSLRCRYIRHYAMNYCGGEVFQLTNNN